MGLTYTQILTCPEVFSRVPGIILIVLIEIIIIFDVLK